ncbi:hypothetical protein BC829DRAFT_390623 [Chytridium lagenaria]|nr:hypothetical protein BC829DRAFT_390623 [Chytridium lagenaria]
MLFVYLPYFTDIIEYRRGPVAFAYAFAYLVIFGVSLTPHSYFTAFIVLIPISPMCWLLLSSNIHISPWLLLSTFSLYGTATVVTLVHLRERESRQRRVFALQKEFLTNSFEVDERELLPFLPILQKADLPSAVTSKVIPISSEHTINDIQDPNYDILKNCVSLRDVMTQWILWDLEGNLVNIHSSSIHILSSHFLRLFISHLQGTWNSDWKQCGVEDKYCEWLCSSFLVNFRMRYVFLFFAEIAFAFTDQLACLNEINRRYIMCTRGTLLRNFRIGLAFLSFIGAFLSFLTPINTNLTKLRLANLAIEIPRSLGFLLIWSNMAWIDANDGSGELFACYIISLLLEASSLYPMTLQHYSILHLITMTQALITICIVRKTALVDNVVLFVMLGIVGYLECILSDKELRRLYILERILGARVELFSGLGNREGTSMNGETMA